MRTTLASVLVMLAACAVTREQQDGGSDAGTDAGTSSFIELASDAGIACAQCGALVPVVTNLARNTPLTDTQCATLCSSVWCGGFVFSTPKCTLQTETSVWCTPTVADCGEHFCSAGPCGLDSCNGCCADFGCCSATPAAPYCRHRSCGECPAADTRCELEACRDFKACGGKLRAEPDPASCADADGGVDLNFELATLCPDACNVMQAGEVMETGCSDAGVTFDAGTNSSCLDACQSTRDACVSACTRESFGACMNCAAKCGFDDAYCVRHCN